MNDGLVAGGEVDRGDDVGHLVGGRVVDDGGPVVAQRHAEETGVADGDGADLRDADGRGAIEPQDAAVGRGEVDRAARVNGDRADEPRADGSDALHAKAGKRCPPPTRREKERKEAEKKTFHERSGTVERSVPAGKYHTRQ